MERDTRLARAIRPMAVLFTFSLLVLLTLLIVPRATTALLAGWYVDAANCPGPGDGSPGNPFCTIQSAVSAASPGDLINIAAGTYTESGLTVMKSLTFQGAGASTTFVQAAASQAAATNRVFQITGTVYVTFTHLTIRYGNTTGLGGGLYTNGWLELESCEIISNYAGAGGGGAWIQNDARVSGSLIKHNGTGAIGGGLGLGGSLVLTGTQVVLNAAGGSGGGLYSGGAGTLTGTLFVSNTATTSAGGARVGGTLTASGGEFRANTAWWANGGGALAGTGAVLTDMVVQENSALARGGGIMVASGDLTMSNTNVISNSAAAGGGAYVLDGNVYCDGGSVSGNRAGSAGGGLYVIDLVTVPPTPPQGMLYITGTQFLSNTTSGGDGGGAYAQLLAQVSGAYFYHNVSGQAGVGSGGGILVSSGPLIVTDTQFISNSSALYGGAVYTLWGPSAVSNSRFEENRCGVYGGALALGGSGKITSTRFLGNSSGADGGALSAVGNLAVAGSEFTGNAARSGGAIRSWSGLGIDRCIFLDNSASIGGGAVDHWGSSAITNSLFARNSSPSGEALRIVSSGSLDIVHSTIATPTQSSGTAIFAAAGSIHITNTIIANYGTGIQATGATVSEDYNLFYGAVITTTGPVTNGPNSLIGDPVFVNPGADDYRLTGSSLALDNAQPGLASDDLDGHSRPAGTGYDRGCYEGLVVDNDVQILKSSVPGVVHRDEALTYTLSYSNPGPTAATYVTLCDRTPPGISIQYIAAPAGWTLGPVPVAPDGSRRYCWYTPTLGAGDIGTIVLTATVDMLHPISADWVLTNTADITATDDLTPTNNLAQSSSVVQGLQTRLTHFPHPVTAAWSFWYYVDISNTASSPATGLVVVVTLPPEVAGYSVQPDSGGVFDGLNSVTWNLGTLGPNNAQRLSIKARTYTGAAGKCMTAAAQGDSAQAAPPVITLDTTCVVKGPLSPPTPTPTPAATPTPVPGSTLTIQTGVGGDSPDTYIYRYAPNTSYHLTPLLKVGYKGSHAALLHFGLEEMPAGAIIDEAWLEVYAVGWSGPGADVTLGAYAISATVQISETTWNRSNQGTEWALPGCGDVKMDRRPAPENSLSTSGPRKWYRLDLTGLVREWCSGAVPNRGVLLKEESLSPYTYFLASAEYNDVALRPRLVVRYR